MNLVADARITGVTSPTLNFTSCSKATWALCLRGHRRLWHGHLGCGRPDAVGPPVSGRCGGDRDVDMVDFGVVQACLTTNGVAQNEPACAKAGSTAMTTWDASDLNIFYDCLSGPGKSPDPLRRPVNRRYPTANDRGLRRPRAAGLILRIRPIESSPHRFRA